MGMSSCCRRSSGNEMQMYPLQTARGKILLRLCSGNGTNLVCLINHAIFLVVHSLAAMTRSPSFSRPSSSMTTTKSPALNAARASSIGSNWKVDISLVVWAEYRSMQTETNRYLTVEERHARSDRLSINLDPRHDQFISRYQTRLSIPHRSPRPDAPFSRPDTTIRPWVNPKTTGSMSPTQSTLRDYQPDLSGSV